MTTCWVFLSAGLLDEVVGDPEGWPHPVRVQGWIIARLDRARAGLSSRALLRGLGCLLALGLPVGSGLLIWGLLHLSGPLRGFLEVMLAAWMLAGRSLREAVRPVVRALSTQDLAGARRAVARVVGRDTADLDADGVARAALETLAESLCDGVVAPLFWLACGGVPGLWAFKAVSTLDSMVGHREAPWTDFGWASARLDDLLNYVPARITALLIALAGGSRRALRLAVRDGGKTQSLNAGVVEAAFAGALGVQLGGINHYDGVPRVGPLLGDPGLTPDVVVLQRGLGLAARVNLAAMCAGAFALWSLHG